MAIKVSPVISDTIYLREISKDFARAEGECLDTERAWVKVRQATEGDNINRADMTADSVVRWLADGVAEELKRINQQEIKAKEAYMCLVDTGNIFDEDGKSNLFTFFEGKVDGGFQKFLTQWGKLDPVEADAIHDAVLELNPQWSWRSRSGE